MAPNIPDAWRDVLIKDPAVLEAVDEAERATVELARVDPATFAEFILLDEETGQAIWNADCHDEWHDLATDHTHLVLIAFVESGKSQHITVARAIWELGRDPKQQILILAKTKPKAEKFVGSIKRHIDGNPRVRMVFPHLAAGDKWTQDALRVAQPEGEWSGDAKDYNVEAAGLESDILGSRYTKIIADDVLDWGNTFTEYQCKKVFGVLSGVVGGRLRRGGSFWFIANAWNEQDAAHRFGAMPGWYMHRAAVERPDGTLVWPERWDAARIKKFEDTYGKEEADRQLRSRTPTKASRKFQEAWILRCLENGAGLTFPYELDPDEVPTGAFTVCGVDLASRKHKKSDRTVFFVIMVHPPAPGRVRGMLQVLWITSGRMESPEILENLVDLWDRYGCFFLVEDNGAQQYLRQLLSLVRPEIPVADFTTTASSKWKPDYGLGGNSAEFQSGYWIIPSRKSEDGTIALEDSEVGRLVQVWLDQLRFFDPQEHTPDEGMGSWLAREGGRRPKFKHLVDNAGDPHHGAPDAALARPAATSVDAAAELWNDVRGVLGGGR